MNPNDEFDWTPVELPPLPSFSAAPLASSAPAIPRSARSTEEPTERQLTVTPLAEKRADDFYMDKRGDWDVLSFGKIYQGEVPAYHRSNAKAVLGWQADSSFRLENCKAEAGAFDVKWNVRGHEFVSLTDTAAAFMNGLEKNPHKITAGDKGQSSLGAFVLLDGGKKDNLLTFSSTHFVEQQRQFNEQLRTRPTDVLLWLQYVAFQDVLAKDEDVRLSRMSAAERKLAILERAVKECPNSAVLHHRRLLCLADVGVEMAQQLAEWDRTLRVILPYDWHLWREYLHFRMSSVQAFLFSEANELFQELIGRPFTDKLALWNEFVTFVFEAGYVERAIYILNHGFCASFDQHLPEETISFLTDPLTKEEHIAEWLKHEHYRERKFWIPRQEASMYRDEPLEDFEREVLPEEVQPFLLDGMPYLECLLTIFGLPPIREHRVTRFAPSAWCDNALEPEHYGHLLSRLPGMPLSSLVDSPLTPCWSLACDALGEEITVDPLSFFSARLPPMQHSFCRSAIMQTLAKNRESLIHYLYLLLFEQHSTGQAVQLAKELLLHDRSNHQLWLAYARYLQLTEDCAEAWKVLRLVWHTFANSKSATATAAMWMIEIALRAKNIDLAHQILVFFALGETFHEGAPMPPIKALKARQFYSNNATQHAYLSSLFTLLSVGLDDAIQLVDRLDILPVTRMETRVVLVTISAFLGTSPEYSHRLHLQRSAVEQLVELEPLNPAYFALFAMVEHRSMVDGRLRQHIHRITEQHSQSLLAHAFAIFTEMMCAQWPRVRAAFDRAIDAMRYESLFKRWYIHFESRHGGDLDRLRVIVYDAIRSCPYCKELYMTALCVLPLRYEEAVELIGMAEEKELRVRVLLEEFPTQALDH